MAIEARPVTAKDEWESFVKTHPETNFLASWMWGEVISRIGKQVHRIGYYQADRLIGTMIAVVEPAKRGRYLAIAAGPTIDWQNKELVSAWRESVEELAREENCVFVRVRPQRETSDAALTQLRQLGFRPAQMHLEAELTSELDITKPLDELKKEMRKNTRYELKRAKKRAIKVTASDDPSAIQAFYEMQLATAQRHGFVPFSLKRLQAEFEVFAETGNVLLYSAHTEDDQLIAQAFIVFYGQEASYHYGASTELGRKEPGAYLIQWKAIQEAVDRGCTRYNFWGVVHPNETKHRFYGVSVFKRGFRGEDVAYVHAHDLIIQKAAYIKNFIIEFSRKRLRRL